jgi:hypothetical protein
MAAVEPEKHELVQSPRCGLAPKWKGHFASSFLLGSNTQAHNLGLRTSNVLELKLKCGFRNREVDALLNMLLALLSSFPLKFPLPCFL